jgi:phosphomecalonate degydratase large subunit
MDLTSEEKGLLEGKKGRAARKAMEILVALGRIYGARRLIGVKSVQVAGVSYDNLGDAGLEFLQEMAEDGRVSVLTTLNPAGMDLVDWSTLGVSEAFAGKQRKVVEAFARMGVVTSCTCTPYLVGNEPGPGDPVAWSESSAVCYANSVLGARSNREGGPSALAAALTGKTAEYGFHLDETRHPVVSVDVTVGLDGTTDFGALGKVVGEKLGSRVPYIKGIGYPTTETLKSLCASIATYGGTAMFHVPGVTPEEGREPEDRMVVGREDIEGAKREMTDDDEVDFVAIGCPHCSLDELRRIEQLLKGKRVCKETWIAVARGVKEDAEREGIVARIRESGAKIATDTCFVVAPIRGRFRCMATDSAKAVFYGRARNRFRTVLAPLEKLIEIATKA